MRASSASRSRRSCCSRRSSGVSRRASVRRGLRCRRGGRARARRARWRGAAADLRLGARVRGRRARAASRAFFVSTITVFERPWLKLCFTLPVSTVRLTPNGARVPSFGFSLSLICHPNPSNICRTPNTPCDAVARPRTTSIQSNKAAPPAQRLVDARRGGRRDQRDMYHFAPERHRQYGACRRDRESPDVRPFDRARAQRLVQLARAVGGGVIRHGAAARPCPCARHRRSSRCP